MRTPLTWQSCAIRSLAEVVAVWDVKKYQRVIAFFLFCEVRIVHDVLGCGAAPCRKIY